MRAVVAWPLREAILAYIRVLQQAAERQYSTNLQVWASRTAFGGKIKPPDIPRILQP